MKAHITAAHDGGKPFECSLCDKKFSWANVLKRHVASVHEGETPDSCTKSEIKEEKINEVEVKDNQVDESCDQEKMEIIDRISGSNYENEKVENVSEYLKPDLEKQDYEYVEYEKDDENESKKDINIDQSDENLHDDKTETAGVDPLKFRDYQAKYQKAKLDGYLSDKHRNVKCTQCDKIFSQKQVLRIHVSTVHEGRKPHKCLQCDKQFTQSGHLKEHVNSGVYIFQNLKTIL